MRIVCSDPSHADLRLYDAEGHEVSLKTIRDISISIPVVGLVTATIEVLAEIDIVSEHKVERKRITFDQSTGESSEEVLPE